MFSDLSKSFCPEKSQHISFLFLITLVFLHLHSYKHIYFTCIKVEGYPYLSITQTQKHSQECILYLHELFELICFKRKFKCIQYSLTKGHNSININKKVDTRKNGEHRRVQNEMEIWVPHVLSRSPSSEKSHSRVKDNLQLGDAFLA